MKVPPYLFRYIRLLNSPNKCAILNPNDSTPPPQQLQVFSPKNYKKFCKGTWHACNGHYTNSATQQLSNSGVKSVRALKNGQPFHSDNNIIIFSRQYFAYGTSGAGVFTFTHRRYFAALCIFCVLGMQKRLNCKHNHNIALYRNASLVVIFGSGWAISSIFIQTVSLKI